MERAREVGGLSEDIERQQWYHTLELAPGVVTPGWFDTRSVVSQLPFPASLAGKRCLDIGTFDGFWAFEMERRGAEEVLAIDLLDPAAWDWPPMSPPAVVKSLASRKREGKGFRLAREALGSNADHRELSVYDLDRDDIGEFDFVYFGSLLIHLRDPVAALDRVRGVCRGELLVVDNYNPFLTHLFPRRPMARLDGRDRPWWWEANVACVRRMLEAAGFELDGEVTRLRMPAGRGQPGPALRPRALSNREGRRDLRNARLGDPHVAILARPRRSPRR